MKRQKKKKKKKKKKKGSLGTGCVFTCLAIIILPTCLAMTNIRSVCIVTGTIVLTGFRHIALIDVCEK
jgi:hypothetical protein